MREQIPKPGRTGAAEHHFGVEIGGVDLADELPAAAARRNHVQGAVGVPPDRDDLGDPVLASSDHRSDRSVLSAETGAGPCVDANTRIAVACGRYERAADVPEQPIVH